MPTVRFVPLEDPAYSAWAAVSVREYADEHVRTGEWPREGALARAEGEFRVLLPQGPATPDQFLCTVQDASTGAAVGTVWFQAGTGPLPGEAPRAFVYDLRVDPAQRGKGYGEATMRAVEVEVRKRGFRTLGLHVFGHNAVARALYEKLGYVPTNLLMKKDLGD